MVKSCTRILRVNTRKFIKQLSGCDSLSGTDIIISDKPLINLSEILIFGALDNSNKPGWIVGWRDGWLNGWMVGWLDGWLVGWLVGWLDGWLDGWMVGWLDGWMVGWRVGGLGGGGGRGW